jgi:hypothetical protein
MEEIQMLRLKHIVPTVALTLATATFYAPVAQAMPTSAPQGGVSMSASAHPGAGPGLAHRDTATVARDFPTANPVKTPSTVNPTIPRRSLAASDSISRFDVWTAVVIGMTIIMLAGLSFGIRSNRTPLAT